VPPLLVGDDIGAHGDGGGAIDDRIRTVRAAVDGERGAPQKRSTAYWEGVA
jgi:hypothetical protein